MSLALARRASATGLALALVVAGTALADTMTADGDVLLPGNQTTVDLGEITTGASRTVDVGFTLVCRNGSHLTPGATVAILENSTSFPAGGGLIVTPGSVTVPTEWPVSGNFCLGTEGTPSVTPVRLELVAPPDPGTDLTWDAIFALDNEEFVSNTPAITIVMDVVAPPPPDTTDPSFALAPADITVTTDATSAVVTFPTPEATDDSGVAPAVECAPSSGSSFALGTTTVTCTATDGAGNDATTSFQVVVLAAGPALAGTWHQPLEDAVPALTARAGRTVPLKLSVTADGAPAGPGDIATPGLRVDRLAACTADAASVGTLFEGTFTWASGSWQRNVNTAASWAGCVRTVALVGKVEVASAVVSLARDDAMPAKAGG